MSGDLELEIGLLRDEIQGREREAAALRADIADIERELIPFQQRYEKLITPMQMRLDVIRAAIEEEEKARHRRGGTLYQPDWDGIAQGYIPVEEQYRRAWAKTDDLPPTEPSRPTHPAATAERDAADLLKRIYRDLARRFHPDLAADSTERERRTLIMSQINAAYASGDLDALRGIAAQPDEAVHTPLLVLTLRTLRAQLEALYSEINRLQLERDELLYGAMMKLKLDDKLARIRGRDLLAEMRASMEAEYDLLLTQLDRLRRE